MIERSVNDTIQTIINGDSRNLSEIEDNSIHLVVTSPPYFNAKTYSDNSDDLGNEIDIDAWMAEMVYVWIEVLAKLAPGRKFFLNIMNLPVKMGNSFETLDLVGRNIKACTDIGFVFKRDIIWHKTNGVKAHFGTYPYPGGILLNNMHEFILEFEKPAPKGHKKYEHVNSYRKEESKLDKEFWLSLKNTDVWTMKPEASGKGREHIAPFPLELPERLIRAYSYVGETVLDPFCGSGTTLEAAAKWKRNGIGVDINPDFCIMTRKRLEAV